MKYSQVFNDIETKEVTIVVPGWIKELIIQYGYFYLTDKNIVLLWKVENKDNIFNEDLRIVTQHFGFRYTEYFISILTDFRKDLLKWIKSGLKEEWQIKYYNLFNDLIT